MGAQPPVPGLKSTTLRKSFSLFNSFSLCSYQSRFHRPQSRSLTLTSLILQPTGYKVTTAFWVVNIIGTALIVLFVRRDKRKAHIAEVARENEENGGGVKGIGIVGVREEEGSSVEDVKVA